LGTDGAGNLSWVTQAAGSSQISNGNSNVRVATANGNVTITAVGNTTMTVTGTGANISGTANITGNVNAPFFIGNGSALTGIGGAGYIFNGTSNANIIASGGNLVIGINGTASIGTFSNVGLNVSGYITASGNVTGANLMGSLANGNSNVRIAAANGNINLTAVGNTVLTVTGTGANINGTANVTGNMLAPYFIGNGFYLTGIETNPGNITNGTSNVQVFLNGNVNTSVNGNANVFTVTGTGANVSGYLTSTGNIGAGNVSASGQLISTQACTNALLVLFINSIGIHNNVNRCK
jgi:hypothetical protein